MLFEKRCTNIKLDMLIFCVKHIEFFKSTTVVPYMYNVSASAPTVSIT